MLDKITLLPVGCVEEHGHLPLETDTIIARAFCELAKAETDAVVAEAISSGFCRTTSALPRTRACGFQEVFGRFSARVEELIQQGRRYIVLVSIHGGNDAVLRAVVENTYLASGQPVLYFNPYRAFADDLDELCFSGGDNAFKECSLLHAALDILGMAPICGPEADEDAGRDPLIERLKRVGVIGFSYKSPPQHVPWRAGANKNAGRNFLDETAKRFAGAMADFRKYVEQEIG
ncbi:MAG: creatininase family protein [Planctomycetia bacterium]|nr:creatininase family protein [Planctomycetia bacterium]